MSMIELEDYLAAQRANSLTVEEQNRKHLEVAPGKKLNAASQPFLTPKASPKKKRQNNRDYQGTGFFGGYTRRNKHMGIPKNKSNCA